MSKECHPTSTVRTKKPRNSAASKALQLEQKLDNIVQLLRKNPPNGSVVTSSSDEAIVHVSTSNSASPDSLPLSTNGSYTLATQSSDSLLTHGEACFEDFRTQKLQFHQFVPFPDTMSSEQLLRERPFLWHYIVLISTKSPTHQAELSRKVRVMLSQLLIIEPEFNIDLLLGLLVLIGW